MSRIHRPQSRVPVVAVRSRLLSRWLLAESRDMGAPHASLAPYKAKRNFANTPEPAEGGETGKQALTFVIQKHWASHLHYDFRLELDGTMKSWAIPKGPSVDSSVKRMAVHVEDHPLAYSNFEGTIPAKQYGAGKVIIWDKGIWQPLGNARKDYLAGNLKFELRGHKLHGKWVLVRMKGKGEKQEPWLLIKEKDAFMRPSADFSVVDEQPGSVKGMPTPRSFPSAPISKASAPRSTPPPAKTTRAAKTATSAALPPEAKKAELPPTLAPQLATLASGPPADTADWLFEIKFDGYRLMVRVDGPEIKLFTRNGNDWTSKLRPLKEVLEKMKLPAGWYDGEIVVPNDKGVPDFGALQASFDAARTGDIILYLFDVPFFNGHDLRAVPLESRRKILQQVLQSHPSEQVRLSDMFDAPAASVIEAACKLGLEGVIAKRRDATYVSRRSTDWVKLKCGQRQEFVIAGYTAPQGSRTGLGALLLGVHDSEGVLHYAGKVGSGFNERTLTSLTAKLTALHTGTSPFGKAPRLAAGGHWIKPTLVAEVSFGEWTSHGHIRHPVFQGLRQDKPAKAIVREKPATVAAANTTLSAKKSEAPALSSRLRITHPERIIDASTGITKMDLVRYYALVGELMMPHLKGRPVSLVRAPAGVGGELFFQKHADTEKLAGIRLLATALDPGHQPMLEVSAKLGLLSAAQWNVVELHTVNARSTSFDTPDRLVFDLDPGAGVPWKQVQEAAELVHAFLQQLGLTAFLKTSGGKGLHVVVPLRKSTGWGVVKGFSQAIVLHLAAAIPQRFVAKSGPKNRVGKIFIDYLRNGKSATTVCAWSARARPGMGISVPVEWDELKLLKGGDHWNVRTAHTRLDKGNAPWDDYQKSARSLTAAMTMLNYTPEKSLKAS